MTQNVDPNSNSTPQPPTLITVSNDPSSLNRIMIALEASTLSTINPMQKETDEKMRRDAAALWMNIPFTPLHTVAQTLALTPEQMLVEMKMTCMSVVLDNWTNQVHEDAKAAKEEWQKKIRNGIDIALQNATEGQDQHQSLVTQTAVMMIMATTVAGGAGVAKMQVSNVPGVDLAKGVSQVVAQFQTSPVDMNVVWGILGPLYGTLFTYPAMKDAAMGAKDKSGEEYSKQFADNYAKQLQSQIYKDPVNFQHTVLATLPPNLQETITNSKPEVQQKFFSSIRITLLMSAMAIVYAAETGHLTGQEIKAVMEGNMGNLPDGDPRLTLRKKIDEELANSGLKPEQREGLLGQLYAYFDSNPSIKDLLQVTEGSKRAWGGNLPAGGDIVI